MNELAENGVEIYRFPIDDETVSEINNQMNVSLISYIGFFFILIFVFSFSYTCLNIAKSLYQQNLFHFSVKLFVSLKQKNFPFM